jgi:hypothetical protein
MTTTLAPSLGGARSTSARVKALGVAIAAIAVAGIVALAVRPTGEATLTGVVPSDGRVVQARAIRGARVLLVSRPRGLRLLVAYRLDKGWFAARAPAPPSGSEIAWISTKGDAHIPTLSAVYGRVDGASVVRVRWFDGRVTSARAGSDGAFLLLRNGRMRSGIVIVFDSRGAIVRKVRGP